MYSLFINRSNVTQKRENLTNGAGTVLNVVAVRSTDSDNRTEEVNGLLTGWLLYPKNTVIA